MLACSNSNLNKTIAIWLGIWNGTYISNNWEWVVNQRFNRPKTRMKLLIKQNNFQKIINCGDDSSGLENVCMVDMYVFNLSLLATT